MATIVLHKNSGKHYVLVGTSYTYFKDSRPSFFGGSLFPHEEEGEFELAAICNSEGNITWASTKDLTVIEVDEKSPQELLSK